MTIHHTPMQRRVLAALRYLQDQEAKPIVLRPDILDLLFRLGIGKTTTARVLSNLFALGHVKLTRKGLRRYVGYHAICVVCGCDWDHACDAGFMEGCSWANSTHTVCSMCVEKMKAARS